MDDVTQESGSQTVESQADAGAPDDDIKSAYAAFGLDVPASEESASNEAVERETDDEAPAIEQTKPAIAYTVKHNKEDVDVPDDQVHDVLQRGLALPKVRAQKEEAEKALDEAAKLLGLKDRADFLANRERLAQQQQIMQENEFTQLREQVIEDYEAAGGDPQNLEAWLDSNPLLNRAKQVLDAENERQEQSRQAEIEQLRVSKWNELYQAHPELAATSSAFADGGAPEWFTPAMKDRIDRGYDPVDAYELAHKGTIQAQTKKAAEQKAIKDQMLGRRSQVETASPAEQEPSVPQDLSDGFAAFGIDPKAAKKYVKK